MEEEVKQYLHIRYQWKGQPIIDADYLLDLYFRANYYPTDKLIDFLCYFYGYKITFPQSDVDFQVEKVLKDYFDLSSRVKEMHTEIFSLRGQLAQAAALQCSNKDCTQRAM